MGNPCRILVNEEKRKIPPGKLRHGCCGLKCVTIAYSIQYSNMLYRFVA
jgi:hypothetical protein